jgi:hypothetical protein
MVINDAASLDFVLVHPSGRSRVFQELGDRLAAIEPPLWPRLIAAQPRVHVRFYVDRSGSRITVYEPMASKITECASRC